MSICPPRCAKGTRCPRKSAKPKTRRCVKQSNPQFYDIAKKINPGYKGYLTQSMSEDILERVEDHIKTHNYNPGDILFVGSTYQSRQYYGLVLVMDEPVWFDSIWDAIFAKKNAQSLKQKGVKYRSMLQSANQYTLDLLFGGDDYEDVIEKLKSHGLY